MHILSVGSFLGGAGGLNAVSQVGCRNQLDTVLVVPVGDGYFVPSG